MLAISFCCVLRLRCPQCQALTLRKHRAQFLYADLLQLTQNYVMFRIFLDWSSVRLCPALFPDRPCQKATNRLILQSKFIGLLVHNARGQTPHLYAYIPMLITQINVELESVFFCLAPRRVSYPGNHLLGTRRYNPQPLQRKRQWRTLPFFTLILDQPNTRLQGAVHYARMQNILSPRLPCLLGQPQMRKEFTLAPKQSTDCFERWSIDQPHPGTRPVDALPLYLSLRHLALELVNVKFRRPIFATPDSATLTIDSLRFLLLVVDLVIN